MYSSQKAKICIEGQLTKLLVLPKTKALTNNRCPMLYTVYDVQNFSRTLNHEIHLKKQTRFPLKSWTQYTGRKHNKQNRQLCKWRLKIKSHTNVSFPYVLFSCKIAKQGECSAPFLPPADANCKLCMVYHNRSCREDNNLHLHLPHYKKDSDKTVHYLQLASD